jgi:galactose mutarotase-like enzyme
MNAGLALLLMGGFAHAAFTQPALLRLNDGGPLAAYIAPEKGGLLAGLEVCFDGGWVELLYRGKDFRPTTDWEGKAPLLWPATGRTFLAGAKEGANGAAPMGWQWQGQTYAMPIHGFARDLPWKVAKGSTGSHSAGLVLVDSPATRRLYPFGFELRTGYAVQGSALTITELVRAASSNQGPMPFSMGNHITFKVPLAPGGEARKVLLATPASRQIVTDENGRPTGAIGDAAYRNPVPLKSLPVRKAVSLGGYPAGQTWAELKDPSGLSVRISHHGSALPAGTPVLFNLWGDVEGGFFSPEPWVGKQNSLATGDGAIRLRPGESYTWTVQVTVGGIAANGHSCPRNSQ